MCTHVQHSLVPVQKFVGCFTHKIKSRCWSVCQAQFRECVILLILFRQTCFSLCSEVQGKQLLYTIHRHWAPIRLYVEQQTKFWALRMIKTLIRVVGVLQIIGPVKKPPIGVSREMDWIWVHSITVLILNLKTLSNHQFNYHYFLFKSQNCSIMEWKLWADKL